MSKNNNMNKRWLTLLVQSAVVVFAPWLRSLFSATTPNVLFHIYISYIIIPWLRNNSNVMFYYTLGDIVLAW